MPRTKQSTYCVSLSKYIRELKPEFRTLLMLMYF